jgi:hypothetical protein
MLRRDSGMMTPGIFIAILVWGVLVVRVLGIILQTYPATLSGVPAKFKAEINELRGSEVGKGDYIFRSFDYIELIKKEFTFTAKGDAYGIPVELVGTWYKGGGASHTVNGKGKGYAVDQWTKWTEKGDKSLNTALAVAAKYPIKFMGNLGEDDKGRGVWEESPSEYVNRMFEGLIGDLGKASYGDILEIADTDGSGGWAEEFSTGWILTYSSKGELLSIQRASDKSGEVRMEITGVYAGVLEALKEEPDGYILGTVKEFRHLVEVRDN